MNRKISNVAAVSAGILAAITLAIAGARAQSAPAQAPAASNKPKLTQEQFKNIQVLKDLPADQLIPAMQFISASLGKECDFCHVEGAFDKDDKETKKTAREMMLMMMAINKDNFKGHREVTCFTCHRGTNDPVSTPIISDEMPKPEAGNAAVAAKALPTADEILAKYLQASGGREAIEKINSRVEKAAILIPGAPEMPIDIFAKAPEMRIAIAHLRQGDNITAYDGHAGWLGNPGRPPRPMSDADNDIMKIDADLRLPADLKQQFQEFRVRPGEKIADRDTVLLVGVNEGKPPMRFYFDTETGQLLRTLRYVDTPLGRNPSQIDFADYRDVDGVKVPFRWTLSRPGNRFTIEVKEVHQNVPVEDSQFAMPAPPPAKSN